MNKKQAHLQMIQNVINRLSHNSFLLKGWSVVLVSAMFSVASYDKQILFVLLAYFPAVSFWGLDGYFLREERLFRELYNQIRELPEEEIDYSMDKGEVQDQVESWWKVVKSRTLLAFHGIIVGAIILITAVSLYFQQGGA